MRIRWFRVLTALGLTAILCTALPVAALVATAPTPSRTPNPYDGALDCVSGERIAQAATLHERVFEPSAAHLDADAPAIEVLRSAARCRVVGPTEHDLFVDVFLVASHALEVARDRGRVDATEGLSIALDVWELGTALGEGGSVLDGVIAQRLVAEAAGVVETAIADPHLDEDALVSAVERLGLLSHADWDMVALARNDEALAWEHPLSRPPDRPHLWTLIWDSRVRVPGLAAMDPDPAALEAAARRDFSDASWLLVEGLAESVHLRSRAAVLASAGRLRLAGCHTPADWETRPELDPATGGPVALRPELCLALSPGEASHREALVASGR